MLAGPAVELYKKMMSALPGLELVASGGVSNIKDVEALDYAGLPSVIIGKAIYENRITMEELRPFIQ